ncbi:MAG TPA: HAD-IA family hydrolase [Terriglobales bacterium]|nr:HAD-IA family hydrolase [Terriglobales bacterium]
MTSQQIANTFDLSHFELLSFDCYGTLIDWENGIFSALRPILTTHNKTLTDSQLLELYSELEAEAEQVTFRSYRAVLQSVVHGFGKRLGFTPTEAEASSLPESLPNWRPFSDTVAALHRLNSKYKLAIISNVDDDLFAISAPKLEVEFDYVITAQQARAYKPSLTIFKLAQEHTGIAPSHWLHVGQSIYHDVLPAKSLGMSTVWVNRPSPRAGSGAAKAAEGQPDLEVPDLKTLAELAS